MSQDFISVSVMGKHILNVGRFRINLKNILEDYIYSKPIIRHNYNII